MNCARARGSKQSEVASSGKVQTTLLDDFLEVVIHESPGVGDQLPARHSDLYSCTLARFSNLDRTR